MHWVGRFPRPREGYRNYFQPVSPANRFREDLQIALQVLVHPSPPPPRLLWVIFSTRSRGFSLASPTSSVTFSCPLPCQYSSSAALLVFIMAKCGTRGGQPGPTALKANTESKPTYTMPTEVGSGWTFRTCQVRYLRR